MESAVKNVTVNTPPEASNSNSREEEDGVYILHNPCYLLKQALKAIMKCLGFEEETPPPCIPDPTSQDHQPSTTPPDPPADPPPPPAALARRGKTPPRPVVSGGRDPQTH